MVKVRRQQFLDYSMSKKTSILDLVLTTQIFPKGNFSNYLMEANMKLMMVMMIRYMISITKKT